MIANWVKETLSVAGTGTVTLGGAVATFNTFANVYPAASTVVRYQIEEAAVGRENGYGTYTLSGTTLARTKVLETLTAAGAYDASAPTALNFTTAATISIAADSNAFWPAPMGHAEITRHLSAHLTANAGSKTVSVSADTQYAAPFLLTETVEVSSFGIFLSVGADASTSALGLTQMVAGIPGENYLGTAVPNLATAGNDSVVTASLGGNIILQPGWYMSHLVCDAAITVGGTNSDQDALMAPMLGINTTNREVPAMRYTKSSVTSGTLDVAPESVVSVNTSSEAPNLYLVTI